ncbi:hypothetical protein HYU19_00405 [Candidatus Woesearchaeota archaeon]|nr:hypothetical protein [Candidatus Woesearchaeota archaeon]
MKKKEIREELGLGVRCFLEARERSQQPALDEFDRLRMLEVSFNRLFLAVEHICNAVILLETGNYSKKHFGDFLRLKELKKKYAINLAELYETTYTFRSYADYRKHPEMEKEFTMAELHKNLDEVQSAFSALLTMFEANILVQDLYEKIQEKRKKVKEGS